MWVGENLTISAQRNAITPVGFEVYDDVADAPVDLTGYTMTCKVSKATGSTAPIVSMTVNNIQLIDGAFDVLFDGRTLSTNFTDGAQETINLAFEIIATNTNGPVVIARGPIMLLPGVSL